MKNTGFPAIIRPAFTLGGAGGSIARSESEYAEAVEWGLSTSPITEVLIEESVIGWKEYELEVMRDLADNVVIICSIENFDPMGVHTGDSITVAPAQTLTDKEYQALRDASIKVIREIGVETGGSNIQFAVSPEDGRILAIEMNPRVSRSSALASKATGFPIAKIAAKLAVGYTLDEIPNDITRETPASFEPTIDYVVVKIPRWAFEKFPNADTQLGTQMKSVGETMAIGRTFKEAVQKGLRGLEIDRHGLGADGKDAVDGVLDDLRAQMTRPTAERIFQIKTALQLGMPIEEIYALTGVDPWFLHNLRDIVELEGEIGAHRNGSMPRNLLHKAKQAGFSDVQIAHLTGSDEQSVRARRIEARVDAVFQDRRHLRGRVRGHDALLLFDLRDGERDPAQDAEDHHDPRRRAEPHRPRDRVRLLLRPGGHGAEGGRVRDHHGQQQPGDREHGLRHLGPAVLRAPHLRRRDEHRRNGKTGRRDRPVRRADAPQAGPAARTRGRAHHRHLARQH